jgi:hypothetical protein
MKFKSLLAVPLVAILTICPACSDEAADPVGQGSPGEISVPDLSENILIAYEQTVFVESEGLSIMFREFSESRCPKGARCFWEGEGIVELVIENAEGDVASALLVIRPGRDPDRFTWLKAYTMDYRITLLELEPYPDLDDSAEPGEYTALLDIEKIPDLFKESYPVQIDLYVHHRNIDDHCDAIVGDTLCFDLRRVSELYEGIYQSCDDILINVLDCNMDDPHEKFQVLMRP